MATGKRYYWIKLKDSFMSSDTVDYFMSMPDGANYVVLYQMLCLKTINTEGRLSRQIGEIVIPYDVNKIQRDCKWFSVDTIRVALELYRNFGLIYEDVDGVLVLAEHNNLVGSETDYAMQKKLQRKKQGELLPSTEKGVDNVHQSVHTEYRDKILDNRDKILEADVVVEESDNNNVDKPVETVDNSVFEFMGGSLGKGVVLLTEEQKADLLDKLGLDGFNYYVEKLARFIIDKKATVSNHYKTILKWAEEDKKT